VEGTLPVERKSTAVMSKAQELGLAVAGSTSAYTSQTCSHCGLRGIRKRHNCTCPHCGCQAQADINVAQNIRLRHTVSRDRGSLSADPEALLVSAE